MNNPTHPETFRLWENPELRRVALGFGAAMVLIAAIALMVWQHTANTAHRQMIQREISIIGQLVHQHPEWKDDVTGAFSKTASPQEYAAGVDAAKRFGYDESLPLQLNPDMNRLFLKGASYLLCVVLLLGGILLFLAAYAFRSVYCKAVHYAYLAERIVEGVFRTESDHPAEGVFSKLAHQFQLMANRLELTLERLQTEKESMKKLLSDISHQLKTPLAALQMFTELAQDEELSPSKRREFLEKGESQISKMDWLIRQLLTVARMEAGTTALNLRDCSLRNTVLEVVESLYLLARQLEIHLQLRDDPNGSYHIFHDPAWLGEALGNIIKNGMEHTPPGGKVDIRLEETSVLVRIKIHDNGTGIQPQDLPHLFQRFYKASTSSPSGGAGIGLSLAKAIVEQHGGFITVRSDYGQGSLFTVTLPHRLTKT